MVSLVSILTVCLFICLQIPATSAALNVYTLHGRCGDFSFPLLQMHGVVLEGREKAKTGGSSILPDSYLSKTGASVGVITVQCTSPSHMERFSPLLRETQGAEIGYKKE